MNTHVIADQVLADPVLNGPEPLAEAAPLARLPGTPFAFIWFLIRRHFPGRVAILVALAAAATTVEAFGPYAL